MLDERYKVKYGQVADRLGVQKVLLPLSYGASSLVLLDMVASLLQEQNLAHKGKQGFELVVVHLKEPNLSGNASDNSETDSDFASGGKKFKELALQYSPVNIEYHEVDIERAVLTAAMKITVNNQFGVIASPSSSDEAEKRTIGDALRACATRSLQEDLLSLMKNELIRGLSLKTGCKTIIYGHSMTRLANEVISLTVKGRGLTIHESVINKSIEYNQQELQVIFPLRDILKAEVIAILLFNEALQKFLLPDAKPGSRLAKNMTVRDLTTQYFDNLDATGYASTASTVVKTAEKLAGPKEPQQGTCDVCGSSIHHQPQKWLSDITVSIAAPLTTEDEEEYARQYGTSEGSAEGKELRVCYGCTVTLAGSGKQFEWPMRATAQEIIDEFVLTDDEDEGP